MPFTVKEHIQKIEALVGRIRNTPDASSREAALDLVQSVMAFHAEAIDRMMEIASEAGEPGWQIIDTYGNDALVSNLLLLHGLHPLDLETRVREGLDKVRPYLQSHGGNVELLAITDTVVRLRLIGSCHGCPSSSLTLKTAIEKSIYELAPDVTSIECDEEPQLAVIQTAP
jgi:Fe-S cluster biogenesis protein NfuA